MNVDTALNTCTFEKSYGDIFVKVIIELPNGKTQSESGKKALNALKDDLFNLLNDNELTGFLNKENYTA